MIFAYISTDVSILAINGDIILKNLTINCNKSWNLRGQAFVIFKSTVSATQALKALQGFIFFDRPLVFTFFIAKVINL